MSDPIQPPAAPAPTPPAAPMPRPRTVQLLSVKWWESYTVWTATAGIVSQIAGFATGLAGLLETNPEAKTSLLITAGVLTLLAGTLTGIGNILARQAGANSAAQALEAAVGTGLGPTPAALEVAREAEESA